MAKAERWSKIVQLNSTEGTGEERSNETILAKRKQTDKYNIKFKQIYITY